MPSISQKDNVKVHNLLKFPSLGYVLNISQSKNATKPICIYLYGMKCSLFGTLWQENMRISLEMSSIQILSHSNNNNAYEIKDFLLKQLKVMAKNVYHMSLQNEEDEVIGSKGK